MSLTVTKLFEWYKGSLSSIWDQLNRSLPNSTQLPFTVFGNSGEFNVWKNDIEGSDYFYIILTTRDEYRGDIVGGALFAKESSGFFSVLGVELDNKYQKMGIGINLYISICVHFGITLINSKQLSTASEGLWLSLMKKERPDIKVLIYDSITKREHDLSKIGTEVDGVFIDHPKNDIDKEEQRFFLIIKPIRKISLGPISEHHESWVFRKPDFVIFPSLVNSWSYDQED